MTNRLLRRRIHTVVVGASQAGLAMSWYLEQAGREHVVLERRETLGGGWRDRWDQLCLVSVSDAQPDADRGQGQPRPSIRQRVTLASGV